MNAQQLREITKRLDQIIELLTPEGEPIVCRRCEQPEPIFRDGMCATCYGVVNEGAPA